MTDTQKPPHDQHAPAPLNRQAYWQATRNLTLSLLAIWFAVTFLVIYFASELNTIVLFGWPLSFYMAAQGVALMYLALVALYTVAMKRLDQRYALQQTGTNRDNEQ